MPKKFNVTGLCIPEKHYMVDISQKLDTIIKDYIEEGAYFTINRARQYGKTTTLHMLKKRLAEQYIVLDISFEAADELFVSQYTLISGLIWDIGRELKKQGVHPSMLEAWNQPVSELFPFRDFSIRVSDLCTQSQKEIILMIDEADKSSDSQIFMSFLGLLRNKYLQQQKGEERTFQCVILAGVYDVKTLKLKLRPEEEKKYNSPWNIAANFLVDLSFSSAEIATMLKDYETDWQTGMDICSISDLIYDYTSGYPFLVSSICKIIDEQLRRTFTKNSVQEAVNILLKENNTLFDSLLNKLEDYPQLDTMLRDLLWKGKEIPYAKGIRCIDLALMFGFVKRSDSHIEVANRIFETLLYDLFLAAPSLQQNRMYHASLQDKNQFVNNGRLNMELVLEKFICHFNDLYGTEKETFLEEEGRRYFLLYLRPIINGKGHYYIEARTRNMERTDVIVDFGGEQFVIELKIWRGNAYNQRGIQQLAGYLDYYHIDKGYMLSFNFNKKKETGIRRLQIGNKLIIEGVV